MWKIQAKKPKPLSTISLFIFWKRVGNYIKVNIIYETILISIALLHLSILIFRIIGSSGHVITPKIYLSKAYLLQLQEEQDKSK